MRIDNIHTGIYIQVYIYRVPRKKVVHLLKSPNKTVVLGVLLFFGVFPGRTPFFRGTLYMRQMLQLKVQNRYSFFSLRENSNTGVPHEYRPECVYIEKAPRHGTLFVPRILKAPFQKIVVP